MQTMYATFSGVVQCLTLPDPDDEVLSGIAWGAFDELLTPAYWRGQAWQHQILGTYAQLRFGCTLVEEVAACLLGGFGMPAELGVAAFRRVRDDGLLTGTPSTKSLEVALSRPLAIRGRLCRYRFPRQKARYLADCLERLSSFIEPEEDTELRDQLAHLPGIGPKTASWIVRNYRASNSIAVIDVHILRAGRHVQLFPLGVNPQHHYRPLENAFLQFSAALNTPASLLDALIWDYMRRLSRAVCLA